jgi:hypothetical protein
MKLDTLYIACLVTFVAIVVALTFIFPFRSLRLAAIDSTMSSALSEVSREIKTYTEENNQLPEDLTKLEFNDSYSVINNNSGLLGSITYNKDDSFGAKKFSLCADFKTEKKAQSNSLSSSLFSDSSSYDLGYVDYTTHPKGNHCFENETVTTYSSSLQDYYEQYYEDLQDTETGTEESYFN